MNSLTPIEFQNQRILTTGQIAEVYNTDPKNISNNFNRNKNHFKEGKHYFLLKGQALKEFKANHLNDESLKFVSQFYLWTERGANRHCKILDTDQAWRQFDNLEETYFNVKSKQKDSYTIEDPIERAKRWIEECQEKKLLLDQVKRDRPKVLFAEAVTASKTSILVGELAKLLRQNGIDTGQNRLFEWMRENGYLIKRRGTDYNMPTQKGMDLELFEVKETTITHGDGHISVSKTPKVTGKGQMYFINKFKSSASLN